VPDVIVVAGVTNLQFSVPVGGFPVAYAPVWYPQGQTGVRVAGVGYNVAAGLAALGGEVRLATFAGGNLLGSSDAVRVAPPGILANRGPGRPGRERSAVPACCPDPGFEPLSRPAAFPGPGAAHGSCLTAARPGVSHGQCPAMQPCGAGPRGEFVFRPLSHASPYICRSPLSGRDGGAWRAFPQPRRRPRTGPGLPRPSPSPSWTSRKPLAASSGWRR